LSAPEWVSILERWQVEVLLVLMLYLLMVTVLAYRLATGALTGVIKWLMRLLGAGLAVACVTLAPVIILRPVLKPEYVESSSPFIALLVLWCGYGLIFFVRWQTLLFYRLVVQIR